MPRRPAETDEVIDLPNAGAPSSALAQHISETAEQAVELDAYTSMDGSLLDGPAPAAAPTSNDGPSQDEIERIRRTRRPMGEFSQKLALPERRGYKRHWFNDQPGRVAQANDAGWSFVKGTDGKPLRRVVDKAKEGGALYAYAMEIPLIFWQEDMARRHGVAQSRMDAIKQNPFASEKGRETARPEDAQKFYSPTDGAPIEIRSPGR